MKGSDEIKLQTTIDEHTGFGKEGTKTIISLQRGKTEYSLQVSEDSIWLGRKIDGHYHGLILTKKELYGLIKNSYFHFKG